MRKALMMVALLASACGKTSPTGPELAKRSEEFCPTQTMACFRFTGILTTAQKQPVKVDGWSEDLPAPGYRNRWRYILSAPTGPMLARYQEPTQGVTRTTAVVFARNGRGGMVAEVRSTNGLELYWLLSMEPADDHVADQFAALAGSTETTAQNFRVRWRPDGGAEILIYELE